MPSRLRAPPSRPDVRPLGAFLPSWVHIFKCSFCATFAPLRRRHGGILQCSKLENAPPPSTPPPFPSCTHAPYRLRKHEIVSLFHAHTPPPTPLHGKKKAKKGRKHSYCLLQSLMKIEIPPLEKSGGGGGSKKERRGSPAVGSCRGIGGEEGPAGGWRRRRVVGRREEKKFTAAATTKTLLLHGRHEALKGARRAACGTGRHPPLPARRPAAAAAEPE